MMTISDRYAGFIGFGLMYLWGATLVGWIDWFRSDVLLLNTVAITGMVLASAAGTSAFIYVNGLELELKKSKERHDFLEAQAEGWKDQAQLAISLLEKERGCRGEA